MIVLNRSPVLPSCKAPVVPSTALVEVIVFRFSAVNALVVVSTITFADFEEYQAHWGTQPDDSAWPRWLERSQRMELAPLPDGTLRRRSLRDALAMEWTSVARVDALAALADVTVPVLVVYADAPWYAAPYLDEATVQAQLAAGRNCRMYVAHGQNHAEILSIPTTASYAL